jgi:hypothetical protein
MPKATKKTVRKPIARQRTLECDSGAEIGIRNDGERIASASSQMAPCKQALSRVKAALSLADSARLGADLGLLEKAVAGCPDTCGCGLGFKRTVLHADDRVYGELTTRDGCFSGLMLTQWGEDSLGEDLSKMRYLGVPGAGSGETRVQLREPGFLASFLAWCAAGRCETLVLAEPHAAIWSELQLSGIGSAELVPLMRRLADLPPDEAWRQSRTPAAGRGQKGTICR